MDKQGRNYTMPVLMPRDLRPFLCHQGKPLFVVDIKSSQLIGSIKERDRRRRDLEKLRKQNATDSSAKTNEAKATPAKSSFIQDETGKVVAIRLRHGRRDVFLSSTGKLVASERDGRTYGSKGEFRG